MMVPTRQQRASARSTRRRIGRATKRTTAAIELGPSAPQLPPTLEHARERSAGGPDDRAAFRCACGYAFEAAVSTSVGCPHCGSVQAW